MIKDTIRFLRNAAAELRRLASSASDISDRLHQLADELDLRATEFEQTAGP